MQVLTFSGPFRELKSLGFRHQKLYARNYRCWSSYEIGNGRDTWIWMSQKRVEVADLQQRSALLLPFVREYTETQHLYLDMENEVLELYDYQKHDLTWILRENLGDDWLADSKKEQFGELQDEHHKKWRRVYPEQPTWDELRLLDSKGWLGLTDV